MRKALALILALAALLALTACGSGEPARQLTEFEQDALDLATRITTSTSTLLDAERCEREYATEYRTLYGKDPDKKSLLYGSKIYYDGLGNSWDAMVREYEGIVVNYEALRKTEGFGLSQNAEIVHALDRMYQNYTGIYDYVVHRTGSADRLSTKTEAVLEAAKTIQDLLA